MNFKKYQHIERFGTNEVEDINIGKCYVFPKIDGTNGQIFIKDGVLEAGSRKRVLSLDNDNASFLRHVREDPKFDGILECLSEHPDLKFFGEWLVPHSLKTYKNSAWKNYYVYDVIRQTGEGFRYLEYEEYKVLCDRYRIIYIPCQKIIMNPLYEDFLYELKQNHYLMNKEDLIGEGIVIKNYAFINKYGRTIWAKIVTSEFKEKHIKPIGTPKKLNNIIEENIANKYCTFAFVEKTCAKIITENAGWSSKKIPHLLNLCFKELVEEEIYNIMKNYKMPKIDFRILNILIIRKIKNIKPELF